MTVKLLDPDDFFIQLHIEFAREYGVNEALMAGKLKRLLKEFTGKIDDDGNKWVRLTLDEWESEVPLKPRTIERVLSKNTGENKMFFTRTFTGRSKWYRLNPDFVAGHITKSVDKTDTTRHFVGTQPDKMAGSTRQNGGLPISLPISLPIIQERVPPQKPETEFLTDFISQIQTLLGWNPKTNGQVPLLRSQEKRLNTLVRWLISKCNATIKQIEAAVTYFAWMATPPTPEQVRENWAAICAQLKKASPKGTTTLTPHQLKQLNKLNGATT